MTASTPQAQSDAVKSAISTNNATASTVTTLQSLLSAEAKSTTTNKSANAPTTGQTRARKPTTTKANSSKAPASKKEKSIDVHQDENRSLTAKERYALATEIVNITLKVLTETLKAKTKVQSKSTISQTANATVPATPRKLSRTLSSVSQRALQPRSGNSTPIAATPSNSKCPPREAPQNGAVDTTKQESHVAPTGECSRLAFSFLRSINTKQLGVKDLPHFQLENGMLVLAGKLLALGLDSLAIKELRIVKGRLESAGKAKSYAPPGKETLAGLLQITLDLDKNPAALPLVITYQNLVLRVISASSKPATIEACIESLDVAEPTSPCNLIKLQGERSGDRDKAGRLLESLSSTILGLCPSLSSKMDQIAEDRAVSPAPEAVLRIQSIGLQIREQWWALVHHKPDVEKELLEPIFKCLSAFVRRTRKRRAVQETYDTANHCVRAVISTHGSDDSKVLISIRRAMSSLAEGPGCTEEAQKWSAALDKQCGDLDANHAQRIAATARRIPMSKSTGASAALRELITGLQETVSGSTSDYECLLADLSRLLAALPEDTENTDDIQKFGTLSVAFALRFTRSYPGQGLSAAQQIIHHVLRRSKPSDLALSWISHEAIQVLVDTGALKTVVREAASCPLDDAFASSVEATTLARALRLMVLRTLKSGLNEESAVIFDDSRLSNIERGVLVECQLSVAIGHASRSKYLVTLQSMVLHALQTLDELYSSSEHPLRRANVATQVLRLREQYPAIVPSRATKIWGDTQVDQKALFQDEGLREYAEDIDVALKLAKILHAGLLSIRNLEPILLTWQRMLDHLLDKTADADKIYDAAGLQVSLSALSAFFGALGEDAHRLSVLSMIEKVSALQEANANELLDSSVENAQQWLSLGYAEKTGALLALSEKHLASSDVLVLSRITWHLAYAEYLLAIDNHDKAKSSLEAARCLRDTLPPKEVSKEQRAAYERAHGTGWLLQSKYNLATGAPQDALAAAKHAMKLINSTWCRLEKGQAEATSGPEEESLASEAKEKKISELTTGVSKLQLLPKSSPKEEVDTTIKGAAFWPLVPLLCRSLMHLSDMYSHHGLFSEASYYSERAIEIAGSVGSSVLLSRTRSHRAVLLSLADKVEEAELCLTGSEGVALASSPLAAVERLRAKGAVLVKDGAVEEAAEVYEEAAQLVAAMQTADFVSKLGSFEDATKKAQKPVARPPPVAAKTARSSVRTRQAGSEPVPTKTRPSTRTAKIPVVEKSFYMLQKMRAAILLDKTLLSLDASISEEQVLQALAPLKPTVTGTLKQRQVQYRQLMAKATAALQMDFAYNILFDSTLSLPALLRSTTSDDAAQSSPKKKVASARPNTRTGQRKTVAKVGFKDVLNEARACLLTGHASTLQFCSSAEVYSEGAGLLDVSMLSSSVGATGADNRVNSLQTGLTLDLPRIVAKHHEQSAALVDARHEQKTAPFEWPAMTATTSNPPTPQLTASTFQEEYINTLPAPWTTVSLSLDSTCTSLYVARYRAHHAPFIVRLPFSRHQDEDLGNEAFDHAAGKEELADIIQLSNTSCHNNGDLSAKGAKSNWWSEREALDRRLQELLINMEDMWFGGFKGVFSPRQNKPDLLARFRVAFEGVLDRHLPSRQAAKGRAAGLALDHNVLELFVNLGSDNDGTIDLDEPISDLLYFVVDMLQFNGERNAYDEIDFDEMTVEILDALRQYHEASDEADANQEDLHVVLVLDKRLQAFPWENLPCLEACSVSRVGSMLSLRDCVKAMRSQQGVVDRHMVSRKTGTFILNPSSDLASTQTALLPALSKVAAVDGADWSSFVNRAPSEADFKTTLETSAMTLYFGHGAGSQYIRPRTIKKLEKCSEVVWLMGCSSGAVTEYGELEPQAVPLAYLSAGDKTSPLSEGKSPGNNSKCLSVVATLWDVTDKDIDRFSLTVGEEWGLWSSAAEPAKLASKTPKKRDRLVVAPTTPQKAPKTPGKTPRVLKTPGGAKTPVRNRSRSAVRDRSVKLSLAGAVARSRDACYLRYLNGAAPVVYGVPLYLGERSR